MDITLGFVGGRHAAIISIPDDETDCKITISRAGLPDVTCGFEGARGKPDRHGWSTSACP
jgi:hypothetical protein